MKKKTGFQQFVLDQLSEMSEVMCRAIFGGFGLYQNGRFFGIIHQGRLYFKTHDWTKEHYRQQGMKPFRPNRSPTLINNYEVPTEVIEDPECLIRWAWEAIGFLNSQTSTGCCAEGPRNEALCPYSGKYRISNKEL